MLPLHTNTNNTTSYAENIIVRKNAEKTNMVILCIGSNRVVIPTLDSNVKALKAMTAKIINK